MSPLAVVLVSFLASTVCGQESVAVVPDARVTHVGRSWSQHDGFPGGGMGELAISTSGHLWIAANNGLARFDGSEFEVFDLANHPELGSNRFDCVLADPSGGVWVGTQGWGVAYFDPALQRFLAEPPAPGLGAGVSVRELAHGPNGTLWACVDDTEVWSWSGVPGQPFKPVQDEGLDAVSYALETGPDGTLWVVGGGSAFFDSGEGLEPFEAPPDLEGQPAVLEATSHGLWVALRDRLLLWDGDGWETHTSFEQGYFRSLVEDSQGRHWVLRNDNKLLLMSQGSDEFRLQELWDPLLGSAGVLPTMPLNTLCLDDQDVLWAGGEMLVRVQRSAADFTLLSRRTEPQAWASVQAANGSIWMVHEDFGLLRWDREDGFDPIHFNKGRPDALPRRAVGIFCDSRQRLWVGMTQGVAVVDLSAAKGEWSWSMDSQAQPFQLQKARAFHEDAQGNIWVGAKNGLLRLGSEPVEYWGSDQGLPSEVRCIESGADGTIWVGTDGGLSAIQGSTLTHYAHDTHEGLPQGGIRSLCYGSDGVLWIGSTGGGLGRLDGRGWARFTSDQHGLPESVISGIFELGDELWFYGNHGVHCLPRQAFEKEGGTLLEGLRSFGAAVGIDEGNGGFCPAGFVGLEGALWIPTGRGLTRFDPVKQRRSPPAPRVMIERVTFQDHLTENWRRDQPAELGVGKGDLTLAFSAVSLAQADQLEYEYQLSGVDSDWVPSGGVGQVRYPRLPPGDYEFRVRARVEGGFAAVTGTPRVLELRVLHPFWAQPSFYVPLGLLALALITWGIKRTLSVLHRERVRREQARKMEALGALAGGIAHDLNNVLTPIFGYTELAKERLPELAPERDMLDNVMRAAERARRLVEGVLNFGRRRPNLSQVQLGEILEETRTLLSPTQPGVTIRVEIDERIGPIMGDPTQLHQVVYNLCTNAVQALMGEGKLELTLSESHVDASMARQLGGIEPGPYVCLMVRDDGPGMPPAVVQRIFEPFFTTKAPGAGTGMGLAVVHGIVTAHDGAIRLDSQQGRGTTFRIYLPLQEHSGPSELPKTPQFASQHPLPPARQKRGEHILIVDDEPVLVNVVSSMLSSSGYRVTGFIDTEDALENINDLLPPVSLAILDQDMPRMKGLELAARLKDSHPELPIILATGMPQALTPADRLSPHIAHIVYKPFTAVDIVQVVDQQLGDATATASSGGSSAGPPFGPSAEAPA